MRLKTYLVVFALFYNIIIIPYIIYQIVKFSNYEICFVENSNQNIRFFNRELEILHSHKWCYKNNSYHCLWCGITESRFDLPKEHFIVKPLKEFFVEQIEPYCIIICVIFFFSFILSAIITVSYEQYIKSEFKVSELRKKMLEDYNSHKLSIERSKLELLLNIKINSSQDYEEVNFRYNNGLLRSESEINTFLKERNYNRFNSQRHIVNALAFFIPFTTSFIIVFIAMDFPLFGVPIGLFVGLFFGYIGMMIGYSINKSNARDLGLENTPAYQDEDNKQKIGIVSGILAGRSIYKHTKGAVKDIMNVDGWKEMK